jgi:hypothetical protein
MNPSLCQGKAFEQSPVCEGERYNVRSLLPAEYALPLRESTNQWEIYRWQGFQVPVHELLA